MNTDPRTFHRGLAGAILLGVAILATGCGTGSDPPAPTVAPSVPVEAGGESVSVPLVPATTVTTAGVPQALSAGTGEHGTGPSPSAPSPSAAVDLTEVDALLADIDTHLSEADQDLATPEGDF